ncbi:MAG: hypothetical protein HZB30_06750 [Nitrospirae bacterium]|nr:hypothetical protein [Nitrospirota bacterium]
MVLVSIDKLKNSKYFLENIRWEVTPKIFLEPRSPSGENVDTTHGYMLYVDLVKDKPTLVIMQLKDIMSKTVGYVADVPGDLLKDAINCTTNECVSGMYPLGEKLENWLKKEFGLN